MKYLASALLLAGVGIVVGLLWLFVKGFRKAMKDQDVILASKLGMSMPIYRECQEIFEERQKWFKEKPYSDNYSCLRMPKKTNAYRRYEQYMFYKHEVEEWEKSDEMTKMLMSFNNPHTKEEYKWIRDLGI